MSEIQEVEDAIRTLQSSFTYDPPEQWRPAVRLLEEKRAQIHKAFRPAAAVRTVSVLAMLLLAWVVVAPNRDSLDDVADYLYALMISFPVVASVAVELITARRAPLVRQLAAIESALRPFRDVPEAYPS